MCVSEREMGKGYPRHTGLPKLGVVTLQTDGKMQTFTLEFLWRNLIHSDGEMDVFTEEGKIRYFHFSPFPTSAVCRVTVC